MIKFALFILVLLFIFLGFGTKIYNNHKKKQTSLTKKILFILMPENYQDEEFAVPYDLLKTAGHTVDVAGLQAGEAKGSRGHVFTPSMILTNLKETDFDGYDALVIPGGSGSTKYIWENKTIKNIIKYFHKNNKIVAAICHACVVLAETGILKNKKATVYPSDKAKEKYKENNVNIVATGCVTLEKEKIITAQSPKFVHDFGNAILELLNK